MLTITTFARVPRFARGHVRDLRVRWACEEAGIPYAVRFLGGNEWNSAAYRARQPFGQVPVVEEDGETLFESGAIVLGIAERSPALLPAEPALRRQAIAWLFAALNTVEPALMNLAEVDVFTPEEAARAQRRPVVLAAATRRLDDLAAALGGRDHLVGGFSAADLMMASVLRLADHTDLVSTRPALAAFLARCTGRPAFARALTAQLDDLGVPADER